MINKEPIFKKDEVTDFDTFYRLCTYGQNTESNCNNGYTCTHSQNEEVCECDDNISKCYSFSCPLVCDGVSMESIKNSEYYNVEDFDFNDGYTQDYEKMVMVIDDIFDVINYARKI